MELNFLMEGKYLYGCLDSYIRKTDKANKFYTDETNLQYFILFSGINSYLFLFFNPSIYCGNHLHCKTIKVFSHRGFVISVLFSFNNSGTGDANIFTNRHRETFNDIFRGDINSFENLSDTEKQVCNQFKDSMNAPVKTAFTKHCRH